MPSQLGAWAKRILCSTYILLLHHWPVADRCQVNWVPGQRGFSAVPTFYYCTIGQLLTDAKSTGCLGKEDSLQCQHFITAPVDQLLTDAKSTGCLGKEDSLQYLHFITAPVDQLLTDAKSTGCLGKEDSLQCQHFITAPVDQLLTDAKSTGCLGKEDSLQCLHFITAPVDQLLTDAKSTGCLGIHARVIQSGMHIVHHQESCILQLFLAVRFTHLIPAPVAQTSASAWLA